MSLDAIPPPQAGAILTVDLGALAENWRRLAARSGAAECAAVVKADAYGVGLEPAARALWAAGARTFFVAHVFGATRLRALLPEATIYVLNGLAPGAAGLFLAHRLRPVLGSLEEIAEWRDAAFGRDDAEPAAAHLDTGLNRLELEAHELGMARDALADVKLALVMSHFASSEFADHPANARQIAEFDLMRRAFPGIAASLANSSGVFLPQNPHYDLVRPGYALYGGNPTPDAANPMRPVVRLEARIIQTRRVEDGEKVGYNGAWTARGRRKLATISLGYADGLPRAAMGADEAAGGEAIVAGVRCPFAGRVSMDLIVLDVTAAPRAQRGDYVELLGESISVDDLGGRAKTIGYEILTNLGRRYARTYLG